MRIKKHQFFILIERAETGEGVGKVTLARATSTFTGKSPLRCELRDPEVTGGYTPAQIHNFDGVVIKKLDNDYEAKCFVQATRYVATRRVFGSDPAFQCIYPDMTKVLNTCIQYGYTDGRTMVYAATEDGSQSHLFNL